MVSRGVVHSAVPEGGLPECLRSGIGEREPYTPLLGVWILLRHTDTCYHITVENMLCLVSSGLDPDLKDTLLADDLLGGCHINAGEFYPHILGETAARRSEQVDPCVLHPESIHLLVEDSLNLVRGVGGHTLLVGYDRGA